MNLEEFFLADYEKMRERIQELEDEIECLRPDRYGIRDIGKPQDLVKVSVLGYLSLYETDTMPSELEEPLAKSDEDLLAWGRSTSKSYYGKVVEVEKKTMPFTVDVSDLTSTTRCATDGCSEYVRIDFMEEYMPDNLDKWCLPKYEEELLDAAVIQLRENLEKALERVNQMNQEG